MTINANLTCGQVLGYPPAFIDYYLTSDNPVLRQGDIYLTRLTMTPGQKLDKFTVKLPDAYYDNATYTLLPKDINGHGGPNGGTYYTVGWIEGPSITIKN